MCTSIAPVNDHSAPRNLNYERDINYVLKINGWILSSIGIWPVTLKGIGKFIPNIAIVLGNLILCFSIIPCALYIVFEERDVTMKLKLLGLLLFCITAAVKYCGLTIRRPEIKHCIDYVKNDWKLVELYEDRQVMLKYGKVCRSLTLTCCGFMYGGGLIYHTVLPFAAVTTVDTQNRTIKPLVYPTYSNLYNVQKSPVYEIVYILHCICGYVIYSVTVGTCGIAALCATHVCGQIDVLLSRLRELVNGTNDKDNSTPDKRLAYIVEYHLRILRFSAVVEHVLRELCLMEFATSTLIICLLEYYCMTDWMQNNILSLTTYALLLASLTFNIFILCYIGELFMEKTGSLGIACFMINWYELPVKTIRDLILVLVISGNPVKITAGNIVDLSLSTFGNVLKTSLAYLSFLRNLVTS